MRQKRNDGTKVWHNPELSVSPRRSSSKSDTASASDTRDQKQHRAALEALFAPRNKTAGAPASLTTATSEGQSADTARAQAKEKPGARIVLAPKVESDSRTLLLQKLLGKLLSAEGRPSVSKAANELLKAGFVFPEEQDVHLKLLEHADESMVSSAIDALRTLLTSELPKRRAVLESRLRRIEEYAEEAGTREKAAELRRFVCGRPTSPR